MQEIGDRDFDDVVLRPGGRAVVDFWAPWCGPCKAVEPVLAQLAEAHPEIAFVRVDVDANPVTAARYSVLSLPTVILFDDGSAREAVVGARSRAHYERAWASWLAPAA